MKERVRTIEERHVRRALGDLVVSVRQFEVVMDALMKQSPTVERGQRIAHAMNGLSSGVDHALYFGLGFDFRKDNGRKAKLTAIQKWARKIYAEASR